MTRGRLCGIAVGLCLGLALLVAPAALATPTLTGNHTVNAVAADGAGGYYAAGSFTYGPLSNAVHVKADGTVDMSWAPNPTGTVNALSVSGAFVYLGGNFTIGTLHNAARVDATTGVLDSTWAPEPDGTVNAISLMVDPKSLTAVRAYLGGSFTNVNAGAASRLHAAAVELTHGYDLGWDPSPDGVVNALAISGPSSPSPSVYIGGSFTEIDTSSSPVARANAAAVGLYSGIDNGWNPDPTGGPSPVVDALAISGSGSTVYLGGSFTTITAGAITTSQRLSGLSGAVTRLNAAAVTASTGEDMGWKPNPTGGPSPAVHALAVSGSTVYLGGSFTQVNAGTSSTARVGAAGVDAVTGYDAGWNSGVAGTVNGLATWNTDVYLGGDFGVASTTGAQHSLTVDVAGSGGGEVISSPPGIDCTSGSCSTSFDRGSPVTLVANFGSGSGFAGWLGGGCSGTSPACTVTLDTDTIVTATFNLKHQLDVQVTGGLGSVTSTPSGITCPGTCSGQFTDGPQVKLTATPAPGFALAGWTGVVQCIGSVSPTCTFPMANGLTVTAYFIPTHDLTVNDNGSSGSGSVTSNPAGLNCSGTCTHPFNNGADVVLTATPAPGSRFDHWSDPSCPGSGTCDVTNLTQDTTVTATFVQQHVLVVARNGSGSGTVTGGAGAISCGSSCNHAYDVNTQVTLTASPAPGSTFAGWIGNGCTGTGVSCSVTLNSDIHVTATFSAQATNPPPPPPTTTTTSTNPPPPPGGVPAPKCSLKGGSSRVLLAAPRKGKGKAKSKVKPGTLSATVHCDRATTVSLSGVITELLGKKPKHGKQRTKSFRLGPVRVSVAAHGSKTLTLTLSRSALADLKHRASMSVALTLTATGGSSRVKATMARLTGY